MQPGTIFNNYSNQEKGAYLGAIASLALADHSVSPEEVEFLTALADAAGISPNQKQHFLNTAREITDDELKKCLQILKSSHLRFSLITELINFAKSDGHYADAEKQTIEAMARELGINTEQFSLLDNLVTKADEGKLAGKTPQGFLESLGLTEKLKSAGINISDLGKGLLAVAAPLLLSKLFRGRSQNRGGVSSSPMGGMGGLGSILSALSGGRGFGNTSGILSRLFGGK